MARGGAPIHISRDSLSIAVVAHAEAGSYHIEAFVAIVGKRHAQELAIARTTTQDVVLLIFGLNSTSARLTILDLYSWLNFMEPLGKYTIQ